MKRCVVRLRQTKNGLRVVIENNDTSWVDWPILYSNGCMAYDAPERIPQYAKREAMYLCQKLRDLDEQRNYGLADWEVTIN